METLIWLLPVPPLLAFFLIILLTNKNNKTSHTLAVTGAGLSFLGSMVVFFRAVTTKGLAETPFGSSINWLPTGLTQWLQIGVQVDPLTAVTLFFVAWTILMIFLYSVGYHNFGCPKGTADQPGLPPHGVEVIGKDGKIHRSPSIEPMYARFFALISLFAFAMYLLVVSNNLLTLYIGWEIMGLCSYLLIGFWYGKDSAKKAAIKAFLTTRVGDVFMLLGLAALYTLTGTLNFQAVLINPVVLDTLAATISPIFGLSWAGLIGLLLFIGTVGKSAQFPLHVWLPDAMEGPTPVSAMIHAATMVSAGVYLVVRFFPLLSAGWEPGMPITSTMTVMAAIGGFTALYSALIGVAQNDIKRVLAYSTISQLGYMIAALGVGAYAAAAFHLVTHAFFKALLFLGSGSVIHGVEHGVMQTNDHIDPQDMFNMGGLRKKMPATFWTFVAGGLALSGFPILTAGFWSKDEILTGAFSSGHLAVFIILALAALVTAFYTMRQITLVFLGQPRTMAAEHAHETPWTMTVPLIILSVFAIGIGWIGVPEAFPGLGGVLPNWFGEFVGSMLTGEHGEVSHSLVPLITSLTVSLGGLLLGWLVYRNVTAGAPDPLAKPLGFFHRWMKNKFYMDEFYDLVFIKPTRWLADVFTADWIDRKLLDGILHGIGRFGLWFGSAIRNYFDLPVINGVGDDIADGTRQTGSGLRVIQTGHVQQYMVMAVLVMLFLAMIIIFLMG